MLREFTAEQIKHFTEKQEKYFLLNEVARRYQLGCKQEIKLIKIYNKLLNDDADAISYKVTPDGTMSVLEGCKNNKEVRKQVINILKKQERVEKLIVKKHKDVNFYEKVFQKAWDKGYRLKDFVDWYLQEEEKELV